ncbi:MAG: hypothetical protein HY253_14780 [Burkholderiales bacterium]|nr:hypothetical protein [Burkholderiales bacterium]
MTLVIAGHDIEKDCSQLNFKGKNYGLFVAADSTITDGYQTLLTGFKKIYSVPIKVYEPYFVGEYFRDYLSPFLETSCFIAFAGSTVIAQHVLNSITNHLALLRYGYEGGSYTSPGKYQILMDCEKNSLRDSRNTWGDDMFLKSDLEGLLSGDLISRVILHAIEGALASAKRHKIDERGWKSLLTQYVVGAYCEIEKRNRLFTFIPKFEKDIHEVIINIVVDVNEIQPGNIAVLGMSEFGGRARQDYEIAFETNHDVKTAMFSFLNQAIDEVQNNGKKEIDYPSVLKAFNQGKLTELSRKNK